MLRLSNSHSPAEASDKLSPRFYCSPLSNVTSGLNCLSVIVLGAIRSPRSHLSMPSAEFQGYANALSSIPSAIRTDMRQLPRQFHCHVVNTAKHTVPTASWPSASPRTPCFEPSRQHASKAGIAVYGIQDVKLRIFDAFFGSVVELKLSVRLSHGVSSFFGHAQNRDCEALALCMLQSHLG
ncbi:hypothetical protein BDV19DRAFT_361495 [Aspergillus venezuelensis]